MSGPQRLAAFVLVAGLALTSAHTWAQRRAPAAALPNFDIRAENAADAGKSAAYMARLTSTAGFAGARAGFAEARAAGLARLHAAFKDIEVVDNPELGTPEVVGVKAGGGFLTAATTDRVGAMRGFLSSYADSYGLSQDQVASLELVANYTNPAGNMAWVEFEQKINGLPVFRGLIRGGFTANGELARTTGPLASGLDAGTLAVSPRLTAAQAVSQAAVNVGWSVAAAALVQKATDGDRVTFARGAMADEAKAWLMYFPLAPGVARLAWATEIWGDPDAFLILTDAEDGTVLFRKNLTDYQTQSATYSVYNDDSPAPMSPSTILPGSGTQAPVISRTLFTLIGNEAPNTFNNLGWMTDGTNITDGNNVEAGLDSVAPDGVDAPVTGSPTRVFNFACNPETDESWTALCQNAEVSDTFFWTNTYHDRLYLLGFTEAARNFQNDNFGRGGAAGDRVSAESQDFSGTNNANFSTPADGGRGRMQMYIFPGPVPARTSGFDHDVLLHELTHGTSNRLHSNAAGLSGNMSRGMGEGWSDFYARALLSTGAEDPNGIYSAGGWVTNLITAGYTDNYYYGIRRFPYAVKTTLGANGKPHNPLTFADIDPAQINLSDGAFPCNPIFSCTNALEVHNSGEVWAMALLEVRARFITRLGFATGNQRILQFVTDGMKLDPVNPTFLEGRDSIIAAANAGGGTAADIADIWAGFAARGMGALATVNNATTGAVTENFNVPGDPAVPTFSISDVSLPEGNAGTKTFTFNVTLTNPSLAESRVSFTTASGTATSVGSDSPPFTQTGAITIPDVGAATPYPAALAISGLPTSAVRVKARLNSVTHTWPSDLDILLVGPGGQKVMLMSDAGGDFDISAIDLTFDDGAPLMTATEQLKTGTYAPTDIAPGETIPGPAPAGPYGTALSVFSGTNPNGTWSLYVVDDTIGDSGSIAAGFSLIVTVPVASDDYVPTSGQLIFPPGTTTQPVNVTVNGDAVVEGNETFFVNLSGAINGFIGDVQGVGTILNDDAPANTPPTISGISRASTAVSTPIAVDFTVGDAESGPAGVIVTAASSNTTLVPNANLALSGGAAANRTLTITPAAGRSGVTLITLVASDGITPVSTSFGLIVGTPARGDDYDGDARADITVFRPSTGVWHTLQSSTGTPTAFEWGNSADKPLVGDFDGDSRTDITVFRPSNGTWYVVPSTGAAPYGYAWGMRREFSVPGDYDGDGKTDIAVFRPSDGTWYVVPSTTGVPYGYAWGNGADLPMPGDYDADGKTDIAVFRPSNGTWYVVPSSTGVAYGYAWGNGADKPVAADYDGDGRTDIAVFRPSDGTWYVVPSTTGVPYGFAWGNAADIPVPGDYDGDVKTDIAVFRPSNGTWYVVPSTGAAPYGFAWGNSADIPIRP